MSERIATFTYAGHPIPVRTRDGYINITELCRAERKRARDLFRNPEVRRQIHRISLETQICASSLVERKWGGRGAHGSSTWAHPRLALRIADLLSDEAASFVDKTLEELHLVGVVVERAERDLAARVAQVEDRQQRLEARRRRPVPPWLRRRHLQCAASYYAGRCPGAGAGAPHSLIDPEIDHFWAANDNLPESTWPLCRACNRARALPQTAKDRAAFHAAFQLYQENFMAWRTALNDCDDPQLGLPLDGR